MLLDKPEERVWGLPHYIGWVMLALHLLDWYMMYGVIRLFSTAEIVWFSVYISIGSIFVITPWMLYPSVLRNEHMHTNEYVEEQRFQKFFYFFSILQTIGVQIQYYMIYHAFAFDHIWWVVILDMELFQFSYLFVSAIHARRAGKLEEPKDP